MTAQDRDEPAGSAKPFLEHLNDLRRALVWSASALFAGMFVAGWFAPWFFKVLKAPLQGVVSDPDKFLRSFEVTGAMDVALQTIFWGGLLLSAPVILFSLCWFIFPGLTARERRAVVAGLGFAAFLFVGGVLLGYFLALPPALQIMLWFYQWMGVDIEFFTVTSYVGFVTKLLLSFGLTFELPIVLLILGHLGIITSAHLRNKRRHAIVIILIIAMVITPTQDPITQLLLAGPLFALYELCIWLIWATERSRRKADA